MGASDGFDGAPRSVIVVGAGIVGLSTAWFLQERGVDVTVVDRTGVAAGSSWGNAGWISPALAIPLNEPANLRFGLRSLLSRTAPLQVPFGTGPALWSFLARFAVNSRPSAWRRAIRANAPLSAECIEAYDVLAANGIDAPLTEAPITAIFRTTADAQRLLDELSRFAEAGGAVFGTELTGTRLRQRVPLASAEVAAAVRIDGQRFLDPGRFVSALGAAVVQRGAVMQTMDVIDVAPTGDGVAVAGADGTTLTAAAAVIATGAWMSRLARRWVRVPVRAGRGYSFTVPVDEAVTGPIYLPDARVACTPLGGRVRVAGTMEFGDPDAPVVGARVEAIVASTRPLLDGVRWEERTDVWVGPRPVSPDGRPVVGEVCPRTVYVAGGHGMWGMTHGPVTGRLLAEQITTGKQSAVLRELDPLR